MTGWDALVQACRQAEIRVELPPRAATVPARVLDAVLDHELRRLFQAHNGARFAGSAFHLLVYSVDGPEGIESQNASIRRHASDDAGSYPLSELVAFAQFGRQATYFATVPALTHEGSTQPVVLLDLHEEPWAVPASASVDGAFALLARYLVRVKGTGDDITFPFDVPDLIGDDRPLQSLVRTGALDRFLRGDESIRTWVRDTFGF